MRKRWVNQSQRVRTGHREIESAMTRLALRQVEHSENERLSLLDAELERGRVAAALLVRQERRDATEATRIERERCLKIAERWTGLTAKAIADEIRSGR